MKKVISLLLLIIMLVNVSLAMNTGALADDLEQSASNNHSSILYDEDDWDYDEDDTSNAAYVYFNRYLVQNFSVKTINSDSVTLCWDASSYALNYIIYVYDTVTKEYKVMETISNPAVTEYTVSGLKNNSLYSFGICLSYSNNGITTLGKRKNIQVKTKAPTEIINNTNTLISKGYTAKITSHTATINGNVLTTFNSETLSYDKSNKYPSILISCSHGDWSTVSELTHFIDYKGLYTIAYKKNNYLYLERFGTDLKKKSQVKIKMKYDLLGDVVTDNSGNYYVVWGQNDEKGKAGVETIAISKYNYSGSHLKTIAYITSSSDTWATRKPFDAGNCSTIITNSGVLVCNYARLMYNGHQSNDIIAVNISDMSKNENYSNYVSHSFDQRVIELSDGGVCFVNQGDGYSRSFDVEFNYSEKRNSEAFYFYGNSGDNYTNSWLGGVVQTSGNVYLVGASAKSMTAKSENETKNLFIKLVGVDRQISGSTSRKGTSCGKSHTDTGIKWITNYNSSYTVANPQVVATDDNRIVVLWEKMDKNDEFIQSYYMILSADGTTIQNATPMNGTRLTAFEDPIYKDGYIYWTTVGRIGNKTIKIGDSSYFSGYTIINGSVAEIHKLAINELARPLVIKPKPSKIKKIKKAEKSLKVTWKKVEKINGYQIQYATNKKFKRAKKVTIKKSETTSKTIKKLKAKKKYYVRIRTYIVVNGKKYYSKWSKKNSKKTK